MEGMQPKQNFLESKNHRERFFRKFFNRHIALAVFSATFALAPEKELYAQNTQVVEASVKANMDSIESERKSAFENFKALSKKERISQKISKFQELFGPAIDDFLNLHRITRDLDSLATLEKRKGEENIFVNKSGLQFMTMGSVVVAAYKDRWQRQEVSPKNLSLKNIDAIPGLSAEELRKFLNDNYPQNYIAGSISEIEFIDHPDVNLEAGKETLGRAESFGMDSMLKGGSGDSRLPIKINLPTTGIDKETFLDILRHEIGHPNDWNNNSVLASSERIGMLDEVYMRSVAQDRFMSSYVEGISVEELDLYFKGKVENEKTKEQYVNYIRTNEYWAEIQRAYFSDTDKFRQEHPQDHALVKKWVDIISR